MNISNNKFGKILFYITFSIITITILPDCTMAKPNLNTQAEVSEYINKLTGFNTLKGIQETYKQIDVNEDNTPFLREKIEGKNNVWLVEINNVKLKLKSAVPGFNDRYTRNFNVLLDPNTGNLLKITSKYEGYDPNMRPEPNAIDAEIQLSRQNEKYLDFPDMLPNINFLDAIDAVGAKGIGSPFLAKEIYGLYIMHSIDNSEARPVWIITLRGLPPRVRHIPFGLSEEALPPAWTRTFIRNVIDAQNGDVLFATTYPYPVYNKNETKRDK